MYIDNMRLSLTLLVIIRTQLAVFGKFSDVQFSREQIPKKRLRSSLIANLSGSNEVSCSLRCQRKNCSLAIIDVKESRCLLIGSHIEVNKNYLTANKDETTRMIIMKRKSFCSNWECKNGGTCLERSHDFGCHCLFGWTGGTCGIKVTGISCQDIKEKFKELNLKNNIYELQWNGTTFKVFCNMEKDGGGWTRILHILANSRKVAGVNIPIYNTLLEADPRKNYQLASRSLLNLKNKIHFKQFYIYCKNFILNRTVSVKSFKNATGVIQYYTYETDTRPAACGTYQRFNDDNSLLTRDCSALYNGKWGYTREDGYGSHPMFVWDKLHYVIDKTHGRLECDNFGPQNLDRRDVWEIYVR